MSAAYAYPKSRFEPAALVDLNAKAERERLSRSALKGFFLLAAAWKLRDEDAVSYTHLTLPTKRIV